MRTTRRSSKSLAVVGAAEDEHALHVQRAVERRGVRVCYVDTGAFPERAKLTFHDGAVTFDGERLDQLRTFYVKSIHLGLPLPERSVLERRDGSWPERYAAERERHSMITSVLRSLEHGRTFVNRISRFELHFMKLEQLAFLKRSGVRVPETLATSDGEAVRAFHKKHRRVIYKPLAAGALARALKPDDLKPERLALLKNAPVMFQERILGDEFRAYVLAGEPVAAFRIPTDGVVDARENLARAKAATMPKSAWTLAVRAVEKLGLTFAAVDLRRTKDGENVVLEVNPTPAIAFFDDPVKGAVINRLADFLVANA